MHVVAATAATAAATATSSWLGQGVAAVAAAAAMTVGLLPRPSVSSHSRGRRLFFFSQMTARVWGGGGPFPYYRAQNGLRGERAHLRPTTQSLNILIEIRRFTKKKDYTNRIPKKEEPTRKPKRERKIIEGQLKHVRGQKVHNNKRMHVGPRAHHSGV